MAPVLGEDLTGQETYQALLRLYTIALQQAIDMQEGNFSWVSRAAANKASQVRGVSLAIGVRVVAKCSWLRNSLDSISGDTVNS